MPTVNIYCKNEKDHSRLKPFLFKLKTYLAEALTCDNIKLVSGEISIKLVSADGEQMMGDIEIEITAHAFPARVEKQDEICKKTTAYVKQALPYLGDVKTWLLLGQLGHSV
jgi:hypothetical protein